VFSISTPLPAVLTVSLLLCTGCVTLSGSQVNPPGSAEFLTVTAELALARGEARTAALQYAAAADSAADDPELLKRAAEVASQTLQPSIASRIATRWVRIEPTSLDARRAAARAALTLYRIEDAATQYRVVLAGTPEGVDAGFADLESELTSDENVFGARELADRLASFYPNSAAGRRVAGLTALRADDPAAAARNLGLAISAAASGRPAPAGGSDDADARRELTQILWRARILAGDVEEPLGEAAKRLKDDESIANRFDYAVLLMTAQRQSAAVEQLQLLADKSESKPTALRLLGLIEFQQGQFDAASAHFRQLVKTGKFLDDAFYYLAVMADRNGDPDKALKLYSQVQHGDNVFASLLRATALLHEHGAPAAAEDLLDRLLDDEPSRVPEILNARARMYAEGGDYSKAADLLQKSVEEYPDNVDLKYAQASIFEDQGKVDDALRALNGIVKSRPDDPAALNALGFTLADHFKSLSKARKLIERAHEAAPKNAAILDSLGWVLFRLGKDAEALPYLNEAYADDRGGDIAAHLGEVLWRQGKQDEAQRIWAQAAVVDADNKLLKSTRRRLQAAN
jgi:tetratricopeptide (TPR) repeat protein